MKKIPEDKLNSYRQLARKEILDIKNDDVRAFVQRAVKEGVDVLGEGYSPYNTFFRAPYVSDTSGLDIAMVGVPLDMAAPFFSGTRHGPDELRKWSRSYAPVHNLWMTCPFDLCNIGDIGDIPFEGYSISRRVGQIREVFEDLTEKGINTLTAGGEHTMTLPILQAVGKREPLSVVHLDAHADSAGNYGGDEFSDAIIFRRAVEEGLIDPERTVQIGIRGRAAFMWDFSHDSGMRMITAEEFQDRGTEDVMKEVRGIIGTDPTYLSVDSDSIDAAYMPGTTLPEPFGLTGKELRDVIRGLRGADIIGADFAEINPLRDSSGISANLGAALMLEMLCVLAEARLNRGCKKRKTHWQ